MPQVPRLRKTNTSGYPGVSWSKAARKWQARIRVNGSYRYLGLFPTPEAASVAYVTEATSVRPLGPTLAEVRAPLIERLRALYAEHGIAAMSTNYLEKLDGIYAQLLAANFGQAVFLDELRLTEEYAAWRTQHRKYRDEVKPKWSWDEAVNRAGEIKKRIGVLPTLEWFRHKDNGLVSLPNAVFGTGHTWQDLRDAVGCSGNGAWVKARNGTRWRSQPEASLSNFLYARGIDHKRGERYAEGYSQQSGRSYGLYDMHFRDRKGDWIDVEIWGGLDLLSHGRYGETRAHKEAWNNDNPRFLGIEHLDCASDARLTAILRPFLGEIAPFRFEQPTDRIIQTSHWSDAPELLEACAALAAQMPDGIFPSEDWLRKRGKYRDRQGEVFNTMAARVNLWLGGTRNVRRILGQAHANTIEWSDERALAAWHEFTDTYGITPSQANGRHRQQEITSSIKNEARRIYAACAARKLLAAARNGRSPRVKWTAEHAIGEWQAFVHKYGKSPTECMSAAQRARLGTAITNEAARIYSGATRAGVLTILRAQRSIDAA